NMAGRGTDIILDGNPETMTWAILQDKYATRLDVPPAEWDALVREIETREKMKVEGNTVRELGGLHVLGTERHEARRIDLQLRGRCGRQGDPGSSRFFLSLEDDLMRIFAGPWVKMILDKLGMQEGERIESRMVTRRIEAAQKKVEERHFEARKNLLEYDEVMDMQRKRVYGFRQQILDGRNCREVVLEMVRKQIDKNLTEFLQKDFGTASFAAFASNRLSCELEAKDFRGMEFSEADAYAKDGAERDAETVVQDSLDENLPGDEGDEESQADWNWEAMAKLAETKWGIKGIKDRDLRKIGRDNVGEYLLDMARKAIQAVDLTEGKVYLEEDFQHRFAANWVLHKFGIEMKLEEILPMDAPALKAFVTEKAEAAYDAKEAEYPAMAGLYRFLTATGGKH